MKQVQAKLVGAGLTFLNSVNVPPVSSTIDIINTEGLAEARSYLSILDTLAWVLPFLAIVCLVGRRRSSCRPDGGRRSGPRIVLIAACAFTLVLLAIGRSLYLDAATSPHVSKDAASAVFDILVRNLRYGLIVLGGGRHRRSHSWRTSWGRRHRR